MAMVDAQYAQYAKPLSAGNSAYCAISAKGRRV
jgi:hypothetical protein